jgi:hypothetical protein
LFRLEFQNAITQIFLRRCMPQIILEYSNECQQYSSFEYAQYNQLTVTTGYIINQDLYTAVDNQIFKNNKPLMSFKYCPNFTGLIYQNLRYVCVIRIYFYNTRGENLNVDVFDLESRKRVSQLSFSIPQSYI